MSSLSNSNKNNPLPSRVASHITSTTTSRPPSPLKHTSFLPSVSKPDPPASPSSARAAAGILPSLTGGSELSKVYGSVLQTKDSLASYCCAVCSTPFPPDATIYPDPSSSSSLTSTSTPTSASKSSSSDGAVRFLCRPCFETNGGSRGTCETCTRPVLILKSEGGFVENTGRVWHKGCFRCDGCFKNIGESPMVDLMGRPCCADCFDTSPNRRTSTGSKNATPVKGSRRDPRTPENRMGGLQRREKSREGSPALEELEQRLGIVKSRQSSPALEDLTQRLGAVQANRESPVPSRYTGDRDGSPVIERRGRGQSIVGIGGTPDGSPISTRRNYDSPLGSAYKSPGPANRSMTGSPQVPVEDAIEEMKRRFLRGTSASPAPSPNSTPLRQSQARDSTSFGSTSSSSIKSPTPSSKIPVSTRTSGSPTIRSRASSSSLRARLDQDRWREREEADRASPRTSDVSSPTSSLSSLSLLRGHVQGLEPMRHSSASIPSTPDLTSDHDFSDSGSSEFSPPSKTKKYDVFGDYLDKTVDTPSPTSRVQKPKRENRFSGDYLDDTETRQDVVEKDKDKTIRGMPSPAAPAAKIKPRVSIPSDACAKCGLSLISNDGGRFVTVPEEPRTSGAEPKTYHTGCFRCAVCGGMFKDEEGRAVFVRDRGRPVHVECSPAERVQVGISKKPSPSPASTTSSLPTKSPRFVSPPLPSSSARPVSQSALPSKSPRFATSALPSSSSSARSTGYVSSRFDRPPTTAPPTTTSFPRFGSSNTCPGCTKSVSPMERGVVPGPGGTRWHAGCLVCGGGVGKDGAGTSTRSSGGWGKEREKGKPGCGKRLDSAAKGDGDGGVWCRECLLLLPAAMRNSPHGSPTRTAAPLTSHYTGSNPGHVQPQYTGTTTLARQFTGIGSVEAGIMRQLTGGGLSPTRQLGGSPTKQLGTTPGANTAARAARPRPKSVIGMRGKSVDEGRGMFLVRQMTGGGI
ncbi:hypothetical protein PLICRDRAFT_49310 [Plicaturopsis crispa FD-325 SS-3]|nr:hypothetical protein PLICRDRAFT_49310 [Plicaturopsis crispa FD-325 SS-3]